MYDTKRIASGIGVLLTLWAVVGLLILSSGVGVSAPLTATGGFNLSASYVGADNQSATPTTTARGDPAFEFRISQTRADNLYLNKTLDAGDLPGLTGNLRVAIFGSTVYIQDARFKSDRITADQATVRGLLVDDRYAGGVQGPAEEKFLLYAGPEPFQKRSTDDHLSIGTAERGAVNRSEPAALQLEGDVKIRAATLSAQRVRIVDGAQILILYDPEGNDEFEPIV